MFSDLLAGKVHNWPAAACYIYITESRSGSLLHEYYSQCHMQTTVSLITPRDHTQQISTKHSTEGNCE